MAQNRQRARAELYLFLVTFIWGSTFIITKELLQTVPPFAYIAIRFLAGSALFAAVAFRSLSGWSRRTMRHGAILGFLLFSGFALQTIGLQTTTASKSAFITGLMVVFTPMWQVLIERRRPKTGSIVGVVLVTVGLYLLTSPEGSGMQLGDVLTIGCAALFGLYIVYLDVFSQDDSIEKLALAQFLCAGILGAVLALLLESWDAQITGAGILQLAYLTVFATVIALYVQTRYQRDSTPTRSAVIFSMEPVLASIFAYLLAGEILGVSGWFGGGLILTGLLVSELSDKLFPAGPPGDDSGSRPRGS